MPLEHTERPVARVGFGGLSQLVSDVDQVVALAARRAAAAKATAETKRAAGNATPGPQGYVQPQAQQKSYGKTWLYVGGGVLALWLVSMLSSTSGPTQSTSGRPASTSGQPPATGSASPLLPEERQPARSAGTANPWTERMPPVGQTAAFDAAQIRYCLAEDVRLEAAREVANSASDVDRFNTMVSDYNARCSNYRYRAGLLESVQRELQTRTSDLRAEGIARFRR